MPTQEITRPTPPAPETRRRRNGPGAVPAAQILERLSKERTEREAAR